MKNIFNPSFFDERHNVLVFETNKEQIDYLRITFPSSHKFLEVSDVNEALKITGEEHFSLVIAGVSVSQTGGFELCDKIKGNLNTCHIPFILISAKNCVEHMIRGYELGADDYITKPYDKNLLLVRINRLIQNRKRIREKYRKQNFMTELENNHFSRNEKFIAAIRNILEDNLSDPDFNVTSLSAKLRISTTQLYRILKDSTGYSPVEFIRIVRLKNAFKMLNRNRINVTEVCYHSGFNNVSYFIKCFKDMFGVTPGHFRNKISNDLYDSVIYQNKI